MSRSHHNRLLSGEAVFLYNFSMTRSRAPKPRVVILGAGFGGVYTLLNLYRMYGRSVDVTIVNRTNYFLFTPMLHEVATGGLSHHSVVEALRYIITRVHAKLHVASVQSINTKEKTVSTDAGVLSYDVLVIALGAKTNFYGIPGAEEHSLVLKNLYDAIKIRNTIIAACERAANLTDPAARMKALSFAVIGGGATGVELVAEMADLLYETVKKFYRGVIDCQEVSIHLSTSDSSLITMFPESLQKYAEKTLRNKHVQVHFNKKAVRVDSRKVVCADGTYIDADTIIWVAGVAPETISSDVPLPQDKHNRIVVDDHMRVVGQSHIFALGDIAAREQVEGKEKPRALPMLAQVAVAEARVVAANTINVIRNRPLRVFHYKSKGDLLSLGTWHAVAHIAGIRWSGAAAWFLWRFVYLMKFLSWSKKIKVAFDWFIDIFYPRDITKA